MAYARGNPKTKKQLKEWVKAGKAVEVFSPGPFPVILNGQVHLEGPHYPATHKWWASVRVAGGIITKVLS